ncbi:alpha/beta hydrolase [Dongia sp.]|uniref:alpha/beta hydrolase n=1 Tax=Dongia sp. TaxID=1977262 RepID=UPI0035B3267E
MIWAVLILLGAAYLLALLLLFTRQRKIVFNPKSETARLEDYAAPQGLAPVTYRTQDGVDLIGWYLPPARPDGQTIAYFHGNAGHHGDRVVRIVPYAAAGYGVLLAGYRGYGGNPGTPTEQGLYADARAALDFLQKQGVGPDRLIIFGESLGSAVATQMATERPARGLILEAPFASILRSARQRYRYLAFDLLVRDKFDTLSKIAAVNMPLLVIHGDLDRTTPAMFGRMVFEAAREPKAGFFPPLAGHNDLMQHGMPERVLAFLEELGKSAQ